jgi:hypothetical protein
VQDYNPSLPHVPRRRPSALCIAFNKPPTPPKVATSLLISSRSLVFLQKKNVAASCPRSSYSFAIVCATVVLPVPAGPLNQHTGGGSSYYQPTIERSLKFWFRSRVGVLCHSLLGIIEGILDEMREQEVKHCRSWRYRDS